MKRLVYCLWILISLSVAGSHAQDGKGGDVAYVPVTRFDPARDAAKDIREAVTEDLRDNLYSGREFRFPSQPAGVILRIPCATSADGFQFFEGRCPR